MNTSDTNTNSPSITPDMSLDVLLDTLGFVAWKTITTTFILPIVNILGTIFCSLSAWIFFKNTFTDPSFFYYRLLTLVYIVSLLHNIPFGILFSPRFFPRKHMPNTYVVAIYQIYFEFIANLLFHYGDVLQVDILLTRMKAFSPMLRKYFYAKPPFISLISFLICFLIDFPFGFSFKIASLGKYYWLDDSNRKHDEDFYFLVNSDFASSSLGQLVAIITGCTLNVFFSLIIGIVLNIVSYIQYKSYLSQRRRQTNESNMNLALRHVITNYSTMSLDAADFNLNKLRRKEMRECDAEKNMLHMIMSLCTISCVSRVILMFSYVYFFYYYSFSDTLSLMVVCYTIYTLVPTVSIFIFYSFNKIFCRELKKIFIFKRDKDENTSSSQLL